MLAWAAKPLSPAIPVERHHSRQTVAEAPGVSLVGSGLVQEGVGERSPSTAQLTRHGRKSSRAVITMVDLQTGRIGHSRQRADAVVVPAQRRG